MYVLLEIFAFVFMMPALLVYACLSLLKSVTEFFGYLFAPGALCVYFGTVLHIFGRPDPSVEWVSIIQKLASISVAGITAPGALIIAGFSILVLGAVLHHRCEADTGV